MQLGEHVRRPEAVAREHDHRVEPEVRCLAHQRKRVAALRGEHGFGRLLADFFQHRVLALGEELRDIGLRRVAAFTLVDGGGDAFQRLVNAGLHFL